MNKREELIKAIKFVLLCAPVALTETLSYMGLLYIACPQLAAQGISYALGAIVCYILNRKFTFETKGKFFGAEMLRFFAVSGASLLFGVGVMWVETHVFGLVGTPLKDAAAKVVVMMLTTGTNYAGNRLWAFKPERG